MTIKQIYNYKPIVNDCVVAAERNGMAADLVQRHQTYITDPVIRNEIIRLSAVEIIS